MGERERKRETWRIDEWRSEKKGRKRFCEDVRQREDRCGEQGISLCYPEVPIDVKDM